MSVPAAPETGADYVPLFDLERARLLALLRSLEPVQWQWPSPCPGWSVLGLAVHLLGDDLSLVSGQRDDHRGTPAPADLDETGFITWLDELQVQWVHAARRLSPRLTVELLDWLGPEVTATMAAQDPSAVTASVSWASDRPVPVWLDQARELTERWIHRQQLLDAIGRPADLRPDLARPVLDGLRWAYPFRLGRHLRPPGATVEIRRFDDQDGQDRREETWRLVSDGSTWEFSSPDMPPGALVVASLTATTDQAWRLLTNNHRRDRHGAIVVDGDPELIQVLAATRAIIGHPQ